MGFASDERQRMQEVAAQKIANRAALMQNQSDIDTAAKAKLQAQSESAASALQTNLQTMRGEQEMARQRLQNEGALANTALSGATSRDVAGINSDTQMAIPALQGIEARKTSALGHEQSLSLENARSRNDLLKQALANQGRLDLAQTEWQDQPGAAPGGAAVTPAAARSKTDGVMGAAANLWKTGMFEDPAAAIDLATKAWEHSGGDHGKLGGSIKTLLSGANAPAAIGGAPLYDQQFRTQEGQRTQESLPAWYHGNQRPDLGGATPAAGHAQEIVATAREKGRAPDIDKVRERYGADAAEAVSSALAQQEQDAAASAAADNAIILPQERRRTAALRGDGREYTPPRYHGQGADEALANWWKEFNTPRPVDDSAPF